MAMREINMVPRLFLSQRFMVRHLSFWGLCLCLAAGVIFLIYMVYRFCVMPENNNTVSGKLVNSQLAARLGEIKQTLDKIDGLENKHKELDAISSRRYYFRVLESVTDCVNPSSWVVQLEIKKGDTESDRDCMEFSGFSLSNKMLGELLDAMSKASEFVEVRLTQAEKTLMDKGGEYKPVIRYTIVSELPQETL